MPQTKRDPRAFLERQQQPKRDPVGFMQRQSQPRRDIAPASQQPEGIASSFQMGLAGPLLRNVVETATDIYNRPLETLERAGRTGLEILSAFDPAGAAYEPTVQSQAARVAELRRRAEAERPETVKLMELGQRELEARPRTTAGKVAFGTGRVLGEVAFPLAPESAVGNIVTAPFAGAAVRTAGKFVAPILQRIRAGRGAATETAIARETVPVAREVPPATGQPIPRPPTAPANPLQSAVAKLGTDDPQEIGAMIANANRRYNESITVPGGKKRPRTPEEIQSSLDDQALIEQLTPAEHRALSQVLPPRTYSPVVGGESRNISDIPAGQPNAQLDANLRELEAFFTQEGRAPRLEAEFGVSAATPSARAAGASVSGPRAETAALEVGPTTAPAGPPGTPPPELMGQLFGRQPAQRQLFSGRIATPAERTPLLQTISSLVKAGLLTRPTTHLKNLGGNLGFQISEELARIPGAIVDILVSPFTKRRTFTGPSLGSIGRSVYAAATKGVDDAARILRTGKTPTEIQGLQEIASGSKVVNTYVNGIFRLLKAEDAFTKAYAMKRSLEARTRAAVLTEIRRGAVPRAQYQQRFNELMRHPPSDIASGAILDAEVATFNNPNITGTIRRGITKQLERFGEKYPAARPATRSVDFAIDRIVPFAQTPANVIARMLEYSGVTGGPKVVYGLSKAILKRSMSEAEQRAFAQTFGRAGVGGGLLALGYIGYRDGWLTGLNEDEASKRARDTATGRIPGAILVNGKWHQIVGVSPLGNVVAIGATLAREAEQEQTGDYLKQAGKASNVLGQAMLEQPLLAGTKQFIEGIEQPGTMGARLLGSTAASVVPGAISDIGQMIDPTQREAQTIGARVMERIPGVRQTLPERLDVLGQPQTAPFPLNPARSQTAQQASNPYFAELVRHDIGISGFQRKPDETDEQLRQRKTEFGKIAIPYGIQLASSPQYQRATPEIQQRAIKTLNERAKELVEKGKQRYAKGPLSPQALIGAATASQARERAKKKRGY